MFGERGRTLSGSGRTLWREERTFRRWAVIQQGPADVQHEGTVTQRERAVIQRWSRLPSNPNDPTVCYPNPSGLRLPVQPPEERIAEAWIFSFTQKRFRGPVLDHRKRFLLGSLSFF